MKLACSSAAYDAPLREGRIDLRGFIRACADDLDVDGVSIAAAHIPTTDAVYLRNLKKLCVDAHLTVAQPQRRYRARLAGARATRKSSVSSSGATSPRTSARRSSRSPPDRCRSRGRSITGGSSGSSAKYSARTRRTSAAPGPTSCGRCASALTTPPSYGLAVAVRNQRGALIDAPHQLWQSRARRRIAVAPCLPRPGGDARPHGVRPAAPVRRRGIGDGRRHPR